MCNPFELFVGINQSNIQRPKILQIKTALAE
jgi:hypothetical protein